MDDGLGDERAYRRYFVGPSRVFLVAAVDLQGDRPESSVARTLRELEKRIEEDPLIEKAVLTVAVPEG